MENSLNRTQINQNNDNNYVNTDNNYYENDLRPIENIPLPYREVFSKYPCFNIVQSRVLDDILYTDDSLVVSAPTGAGKTVIFELAIVRLLIACENTKYANLLKIVYICPMKALCEERLVDWHKKFSVYNLNCISVTGDSDNIDFKSLLNHNLIITTPEKWDSLTRKWRDNKKLVQVIKLFMIDEVHLIHEENRGSTLETIVCRMKTIQDSIRVNNNEDNNGIEIDFNHKIRFIALSATIPNIEDIAEWIGNKPNIKYFKFSDDIRPVKLEKIVLGYPFNPNCSSPFKFDLSLNYRLPSLIMQYSKGKPALIFCSTRKSVEMTANQILKNLTFKINDERKQILLNATKTITDHKLNEILIHGIGYHHAGMIAENRRCIENLFRNGELPVLVTTSTLALGVNLPAYLVIIKSTKCYTNREFQDYTETALLQMIGRAGRPQFDNTAVALILTTRKDKEKFEKMIGGNQPLESNLHKHLTEHLNSEVVLHTITDLHVAMQWLSSTFLYIRARKNPRYYGLPLGLTSDQYDKKLLAMCQIEINKLVKAGMLTLDQNVIISPTITGELMARYYIAFETMKLFTQLNGAEILQQILSLISRCYEFSEMYLRVNDKKCLNVLNSSKTRQTIRFPLNGKIKTLDMKINCIIQAVFGCLDIFEHSIQSEAFKIMRNGERIAKCLIEYLYSIYKLKKTCYFALLNTIILSKCFQAKLWENSPYVSKQLNGIGNVMSSQLVSAGRTSFSKILESNPREIELIINKKPPIGTKIIEQIEHLPKYKLKLERLNNELNLLIELENSEQLKEQSTIDIHTIMYLLVGDNLNNILLYEKYTHSFMLERIKIVKQIEIVSDDLPNEIYANFISENWVGIDCKVKLQYLLNENGNTNENDFNKSDNKICEETSKSVSNIKNNEKQNVGYMPKFMEIYKQYKNKKQLIKINKEKNEKINKIQDTETITTNCNLNTEEKSLFERNSDKSTSIILEENDKENLDIISEENQNQNLTTEDNIIIENEENNNKQVHLIESNEKNSNYLNYKLNKNSEKALTSSLSETKSNVINSSPEKSTKLIDLQQFQYTPHKKINNESELKNNCNDLKMGSMYVAEIIELKNNSEIKNSTNQKSIKWRSPLTYSPPNKFSPKLQGINKNKNFHSTEISNNSTETSMTSTIGGPSPNKILCSNIHNNYPYESLKTSIQFPLCDKDYIDDNMDDEDDNNSWDSKLRNKKVIEDFGDFCSTSFLEDVGLIENNNIVNESNIKMDVTSQRLKLPSDTISPRTCSGGVDYYSKLLSQPILAVKTKSASNTDERNESFNYNCNDRRRNISEVQSSNVDNYYNLDKAQQNYKWTKRNLPLNKEIRFEFENNCDRSTTNWNHERVLQSVENLPEFSKDYCTSSISNSPRKNNWKLNSIANNEKHAIFSTENNDDYYSDNFSLIPDNNSVSSRENQLEISSTNNNFDVFNDWLSGQTNVQDNYYSQQDAADLKRLHFNLGNATSNNERINVFEQQPNNLPRFNETFSNNIKHTVLNDFVDNSSNLNYYYESQPKVYQKRKVISQPVYNEHCRTIPFYFKQQKHKPFHSPILSNYDNQVIETNTNRFTNNKGSELHYSRNKSVVNKCTTAMENNYRSNILNQTYEPGKSFSIRSDNSTFNNVHSSSYFPRASNNDYYGRSKNNFQREYENNYSPLRTCKLNYHNQQNDFEMFSGNSMNFSNKQYLMNKFLKSLDEYDDENSY